MEAEVQHSEETLRRRRKLSLAWGGLVVVWSLVRALIVWAAVGDYGLNPWIYLAIDLASATVDAITTPRMVLAFIDDRHRAAAGWALISLIAFIIPDIYIFLGTQTLPKRIIIAVSIIIAITLTLAIVGVVRKVRKGRKFREELAQRSVEASQHA